MKLLLDTHTFLWQLYDPNLISKTALAALSNPRYSLFVSAASLWEIGILISLKRIKSKDSSAKMLEESHSACGIELLPVDVAHAEIVSKLPYHHRDPFYRLIIAQAQSDKLTIIGTDNAFDSYKVSRLW
ncbi:type II toxin-antitoxin system VapC family toxin [Bdellovibrionota bacterium FG-2]